MKRTIAAVALVLAILAVGTGAWLAGGRKNEN